MNFIVLSEQCDLGALVCQFCEKPGHKLTYKENMGYVPCHGSVAPYKDVFLSCVNCGAEYLVENLSLRNLMNAVNEYEKNIYSIKKSGS